MRGGAGSSVKENKDDPWYMLCNWITKKFAGIDDELPVGTGRVYQAELMRVAAYRDRDDEMIVCSEVCLHLQCVLDGNPVDETWDCLRQGSRFKPTGEVISIPAEQPLEQVAVGNLDASGWMKAGG